MVLGQPTPLFQVAVTQSGSNLPPLRRQEFVVTEDPPTLPQDLVAYDTLVNTFGIEADPFTKQSATETLIESDSFARNVRGTRRIRVATRVFFDLIDQGSLLEV